MPQIEDTHITSMLGVSLFLTKSVLGSVANHTSEEQRTIRLIATWLEMAAPTHRIGLFHLGNSGSPQTIYFQILLLQPYWVYKKFDYGILQLFLIKNTQFK